MSHSDLHREHQVTCKLAAFKDVHNVSAASTTSLSSALCMATEAVAAQDKLFNKKSLPLSRNSRHYRGDFSSVQLHRQFWPFRLLQAHWPNPKWHCQRTMHDELLYSKASTAYSDFSCGNPLQIKYTEWEGKEEQRGVSQTRSWCCSSACISQLGRCLPLWERLYESTTQTLLNKLVGTLHMQNLKCCVLQITGALQIWSRSYFNLFKKTDNMQPKSTDYIWSDLIWFPAIPSSDSALHYKPAISEEMEESTWFLGSSWHQTTSAKPLCGCLYWLIACTEAVLNCVHDGFINAWILSFR